jgi:DNA-binding NtrC family response regulator
VRDQLEALVNQLVGRGILLNEALQEFEKRFIRKTLDSHSGNQIRTAKVLGIHRNTLSRKMDLYKFSRNHRHR